MISVRDIAIAGLVAAVCGSSTLRADLINADFEAGDTSGWAVLGDNAILTTDPLSGTYHLALSADDGGLGFSVVWQDEAASGGETWTASIHARLLDTPGGAAQALVKLEFLGGSGLVLSDTLTTVSSGPGDYTLLSATGVAPAGTTIARITPAVELNGETGSIEAYFDDASLTLVPEPSAAVLLLTGVLPLMSRRRRSKL